MLRAVQKTRWVSLLPGFVLPLALSMLGHCATATSHNPGSVLERLSSEHQPVIVAHRGASGHVPENTLAAYRKAIELAAPAAECDLYLSADDEIVLMHDETLERTTSGSGAIAHHTLAQIKSLDAGSWYGARFVGEQVPTLGELLELAADRLVLFLEIKAGDGIERAVLAELAAHNAQDAVVVLSFDPEVIRRIRSENPDIATLLLLGKPASGEPYAADVIAQAQSLGVDAIGLDFPYITEDIINQAHGYDLLVYAWTVNDPDDARKLMCMNIDGIITDVPDALAGLNCQ